MSVGVFTPAGTGTDVLDHVVTRCAGEPLRIDNVGDGGETDHLHAGHVSARDVRRLRAAGLVSNRAHGLTTPSAGHVRRRVPTGSLVGIRHMHKEGRMTTNFYTVKGGQGATTLAAAAAVRTARLLPHRPATIVVSDQQELEDLAAALGVSMPTWDGIIEVPMHEGSLAAYSREAAMCADIIEPDYTVGHEWRAGTNNVLVIRACYLALRRATSKDDGPDLAVFIPEPGRALGRSDIESALGCKVIEAPWDPMVSRAVDAGILAYQIPKTLEATIDEISKHPARY